MEQFFYTRREPKAPEPGETELQFNEWTDSFDLNKVLRTTEFAKGQIVVVLNDGHEEAHDVRKEMVDSKGQMIRDNKGNPRYEIKRERGWYASQVYLNESDTLRFWEKLNK